MKERLNRVGLTGLLLLVVSMAAIACGQESAEPLPTATSDAGATPMADAATPPTATTAPTVVPSEPTGSPERAAAPTETPTATPAAPSTPEPSVSRREGDTGGASLVLLSSRSAGVHSGPGSIGGFSLSPAPQAFATAGSLTVSAIGSVTVAADEAYVLVVPEMNFGPSGPEQLSDRDREEILTNLEAIGVAEEDIEFEVLNRYDPATISVEVSVAEVATMGESILDAVEEVVRRSESFGVRFSLTESNCEQAISLARREAVPAAEKAADDLADALGMQRGDVLGALEYPLESSRFLPFGSAPGPCGGQDAFPYGALLPFDSNPKVEVSVGLQVAYDLF